MTDKGIVFKGPDGGLVEVLAIDTGVADGQGHQLYRLAVDSAVSIDPGTITIGAVTIKDNTAATAATVKVVTSIGEGDDAIAVQAPVLGKTTDTVDLVGAATTLNAKMRGLIQLLVAKINVKVADGDSVTIGTTTDAAVVTDATGTVQQYLRGIVKLIVAKINVKVADGDDATQGITTGTKVVTDAAGTIQQYLRGLVAIYADVWVSASHWLKVHDLSVGSVGDAFTDGTLIGLLGTLARPDLSIGVAGAAVTSANASASAIAVTDAPTTGKNLVIENIIASSDTTLVISFTEETSGTLILKMYVAANTPVLSSGPLNLKLPTADKKLKMQTNASGNIAVTVTYFSK